MVKRMPPQLLRAAQWLALTLLGSCFGPPCSPHLAFCAVNEHGREPEIRQAGLGTRDSGWSPRHTCRPPIAWVASLQIVERYTGAFRFWFLASSAHPGHDEPVETRSLPVAARPRGVEATKYLRRSYFRRGASSWLDCPRGVSGSSRWRWSWL